MAACTFYQNALPSEIGQIDVFEEQEEGMKLFSY
jgi:hypothetical protein